MPAVQVIRLQYQTERIVDWLKLFVKFVASNCDPLFHISAHGRATASASGAMLANVLKGQNGQHGPESPHFCQHWINIQFRIGQPPWWPHNASQRINRFRH